MRVATMFCVLLALAAVSAAQDTNFPVGPQYLITSDSPMFLQSIATPSLSLSAPFPNINAPVADVTKTPEPSTYSAGLPAQPDLTRIYWGEPPTKELVNEIEISSAPPPRALPSSILDVGVTAMIDPQSLRDHGYGVPLGEAASFWKAHRPHATHVYTNADIDRLHTS